MTAGDVDSQHRDENVRLQDENYGEMSREELLREEARIHDSEYSDTLVFGTRDLKIRDEDFWRVNQRPYRSGAYVRGFRKRRLFELIDLETLSGDELLDVGCGIGQHAVLCALHGARVTGIDISGVAVERARELAEANGVLERCSFRVASADDLPFEDERFDRLLCNAVLHHIWKYESALDELRRVLRSGGRLYFAEGMRSNPVYRLVRNVKRAWTGEEVKGDVDLEFEDLESYGQRYGDFYIEFYTLLSASKELLAGTYGSPAPVRAVLWITETLDDLLLRIPWFQRFALEVVGYMEKEAEGTGHPDRERT